MSVGVGKPKPKLKLKPDPEPAPPSISGSSMKCMKYDHGISGQGHGGLLVMARRSMLNKVGIPTAFRLKGSRLDLP